MKEASPKKKPANTENAWSQNDLPKSKVKVEKPKSIKKVQDSTQTDECKKEKDKMLTTTMV